MNRNPDVWFSNLHNHRRAGELFAVIKKKRGGGQKNGGEKWDVDPPPFLSVTARKGDPWSF